MLDTAENTYYTFLDGIKKTYTGTVIPEVFNRLINEWGLDEWLKANVSDEEGVEMTQKQIDDLQLLKVITDGQFVYNGDVIYPIAPDVLNTWAFSKPDKLVSIRNNQVAPLDHQIYPKYLRLLGVAFKLNYVNNVCALTGISDWQKVQIMRSYERNEIEDNLYRKPTDARLYYEMMNDKYYLRTGTLSTGNAMRLEYLRYPKTFFFDPNRNVKGLLTILTNAITTGTVGIVVTTTGPTLTIPVSPILIHTSKYTLAQTLYNYIITNFPAFDACSLNDNSVGIGITGYDVLTITVTLTNAPITYTTSVGDAVTDVNIELPDQQRKEVVEHTIRVFLERVNDVRYKTYINEENYRSQGKK